MHYFSLVAWCRVQLSVWVSWRAEHYVQSLSYVLASCLTGTLLQIHQLGMQGDAVAAD